MGLYEKYEKVTRKQWGRLNTNLYEEMTRHLDVPQKLRMPKPEGFKPRTSKRNFKAKRRSRDAKRVPLTSCMWCGNTEKLDRHHDWRNVTPGRPSPLPIVLCHACHDRADGRKPPRCWKCNYWMVDLEAYIEHVRSCGAPA